MVVHGMEYLFVAVATWDPSNADSAREAAAEEQQDYDAMGHLQVEQPEIFIYRKSSRKPEKPETTIEPLHIYA